MAGATVGAVGGAFSLFGGGTFDANVAWGIGQGAATGGLDAALWGNDIGEGMLYRAAIGGAFASATSGIASGTFASASQTLVTDGPLGYANEIFNAGKLHIKSQFLAPNYNPLWSEWNKGFKWFYLAN